MIHILFWPNEPKGFSKALCEHCGVTETGVTRSEATLEAFTQRTLAKHKDCKVPT